MKKTVIAAIAISAFVFAATASAALVPSVFDPGNTGCVTSTYSHGVLHLAKNCPSETNAAAQADITGLTGQMFSTASFTLAGTSQCQGGSPRFNITTTDQANPRFLGCNNVTPTINADGTATYNFTTASFAAAGQTAPTGTITSVQVMIDIQGTADLSHITVNGVLQVPTKKPADKCKHGQWRDRHFRNQGQCVSHDRHERNKARQDERTHHA